MSGIVKDVLGLICSKLRDYAAEKLSDGDLHDEQCRKIVVRELDDIKSKLDGLSRKDLLASLHVFKEGVTRLYSSLESSGGSFDGANSSKVFADQITAEEAIVAGAAAMTQHDIVQTVSELSNAVGKLRIASQGRYESARESFKEAKRLATEAFSNVALSTEDRVMASKLRIASRLLESLDDPEAAVTDCLLYLQDLQDLSSIQAVFSVWKKESVGAFLRARFNKKSRNAIVESIQLMNTLLIDMMMTFTNISMAFFQWPTIKIGNGMFHPLAENDKTWRKHERNDLNVPWKRTFSCLPRHCSFGLTSKGELISSKNPGSNVLEISNGSGEKRLFTTISIPSVEVTEIFVAGLTIDEGDNVYVVVAIKYPNYDSVKAKLITFDANGSEKSCRFLDNLANSDRFLAMSINTEGLVVIYQQSIHTIFVYDSKGTRQDYKFALSDKISPSIFDDDFSLTVSSTNAIFFACSVASSVVSENEFVFYIMAMDGKLKRSLRVPCPGKQPKIKGVVFNHVNGTVLVCLAYGWDDRKGDRKHCITIYSFSETGDLLDQIKIPRYDGRLLSHLNGHLVLLLRYGREAIILQ